MEKRRTLDALKEEYVRRFSDREVPLCNKEFIITCGKTDSGMTERVRGVAYVPAIGEFLLLVDNILHGRRWLVASSSRCLRGYLRKAISTALDSGW